MVEFRKASKVLTNIKTCAKPCRYDEKVTLGTFIKNHY